MLHIYTFLVDIITNNLKNKKITNILLHSVSYYRLGVLKYLNQYCKKINTDSTFFSS